MKRWMMGAFFLAVVAGVAYLATLGCCELMGVKPRVRSLTGQMELTSDQRLQVSTLEREFLARKKDSCGVLCEKRAQLIQMLKKSDPDRAALYTLTEEIGREQVALEKATLEHLLAVARILEPAQRERLVDGVAEQLRSACRATACGMTKGCLVAEANK